MEETKNKKNFNIFIGIVIVLFIIILLVLLITKLATLKQVLLLVGIIIIIVIIGFLVYFLYSRKVTISMEGTTKLKDEKYYHAKLWDYLLEKGIQPEKFEVSNRIVGRSGEWVMFARYKNYWYPYESGFIVIDCNRERISECKDEKELRETIFGSAVKPYQFIRKGKATKGILGEEEEYEEIPVEEMEEIEKEKIEKEKRKI